MRTIDHILAFPIFFYMVFAYAFVVYKTVDWLLDFISINYTESVGVCLIYSVLRGAVVYKEERKNIEIRYSSTIVMPWVMLGIVYLCYLLTNLL